MTYCAECQTTFDQAIQGVLCEEHMAHAWMVWCSVKCRDEFHRHEKELEAA